MNLSFIQIFFQLDSQNPAKSLEVSGFLGIRCFDSVESVGLRAVAQACLLAQTRRLRSDSGIRPGSAQKVPLSTNSVGSQTENMTLYMIRRWF